MLLFSNLMTVGPRVQSGRLEFVVPTSFVSDDKSRVPQESCIMSSSSVSHNP
eukprot:UN21369